MSKVKIGSSPVLDILIKKLSQISIEDEVEIYSSPFRRSFGGPSWDFAGFREYSPTDDSKRIDWKASIRSSKLLVKEYTEIQTLNILFLVDVGSSMLLGTIGKRKIDFASEVIVTLSYAILKAKGKVRLLLFSDFLKRMIVSVNDIRQFYYITTILSNEKFFGGKTNFKKSASRVIPHLRKSTVLIVVTDFLNLGEGWQQTLKSLGSHVHSLSIMIRDPLDKFLPKGIHKAFIEEPTGGRTIVFNASKYRKKYEEESKKQEEEVRAILHSVHAELLILDTSEPFLENLILFLQRRRMWL